MLNNIKHSHPTHVNKLINLSLGQSHIEYGLPIWYNNKSEQILKIHKKAIRDINNSKYNAHTDPPFVHIENVLYVCT